MGLLNKRNLAKAKALAEKNKDKIASSVNKATDAIDKKTGGKHTDKLKKIDDAAKKFAGDTTTSETTTSDTTTSDTTTSETTTGGSTTADRGTPVTGDTPPASPNT